MAKPLTRNEINVLQENLDLFGEVQPEDDTPSTRKPGRPAKKPKTNKRKTARKSATPAPATQDMLNDLPSQDTPTADNTAAAETARQASPLPAEQNGPQRIYLAVRAKSATTAKDLLESQGIQVENYAMEKRDPTLRNIHEALLDKGLEYRQGDNILHWALINHDQSPARLLAYDIIEVAFEADWLEAHKQSIRRLKGGDYLDACADIAGQLQIKQPAADDSVNLTRDS